MTAHHRDLPSITPRRHAEAYDRTQMLQLIEDALRDMSPIAPVAAPMTVEASRRRHAVAGMPTFREPEHRAAGLAARRHPRRVPPTTWSLAPRHRLAVRLTPGPAVVRPAAAIRCNETPRSVIWRDDRQDATSAAPRTRCRGPRRAGPGVTGRTGPILDAARELLIEEGFAGLRLEHVAARAGVGKATIYRHWGSREELALELLVELAGPHIPVADTGDTRQELLAAVMNPLRALTETPFGPVIRALLSEIAMDPALGRPVPGDRRPGASGGGGPGHGPRHRARRPAAGRRRRHRHGAAGRAGLLPADVRRRARPDFAERVVAAFLDGYRRRRPADVDWF